MDRKLRIGIIGLGQIGQYHLEEYSRIQDVELVAACDINENQMHAVCNSYNIGKRYEKYTEMLAKEDLDAVDVCLHNNYHAKVSVAVLESGKHCYCEKPIAGSYTDGKKMLEAAQKAGKKLHIQLSTLFSRESVAAKEIVDSGKLGEIYYARSFHHRRRGRPYVDGYGSRDFVKKEITGGGALFDTGVYNIGLLLYLLGMPTVKRITGTICQKLPMDKQRALESGYNVEELAKGMVFFEKNLLLDIFEAWAVHMKPGTGNYILGSEGGLSLEPLNYYSTFCDMDMDSSFDLDSMDFRWHKLRKNQDAYDSSQKHWIAALKDRVPLLPTAEIALETMLIQEGIYLSAKLGREVSAKEVTENSISLTL